MAEELARKYGFIDHGQVGNLRDVYHFELPEMLEKYSTSIITALKEEYMVRFVERQHYKQMTPKKIHH